MIDAHHHLWSYSKEDYPWIPAKSPLATDQLLPELETETEQAGVDGSIVVQARQELEESDFLLALADQSDVIRGVVGWVPLTDEAVGTELARLASLEKFKGVRHVLQDEPDEYFRLGTFHRGLSMLPSHDLRYDLLIYQRQLPVALELVDQQPELGIILDHLAKPEARNGRVEEDWRRGMRELARRDHLLGVKFSGLVTEFPEGPIDPATVRAYFEETLEIFGTDRVMFGTDWPVCLLRLGSYSEWADTVRGLVAALSPDERKAILGGNATRTYRLSA